MNKIKKFFIATSLLVTSLAFPATALAATLSLSPASGTFNKGCNVTIKVELDTTGTNTDGTDVILTYDVGKFTVTPSSITNGTIYADYPGNSVDSSSGKISISGISSVSSPFNGKGTFATLNLKVNDSAQGATTLKFDFDPNDKTKTTDSNVVERGTIADVLSSVTDGSYTIGSGSGCTSSDSSAQGGLSGSGSTSSSSAQGAPGLKTLSPGGNSPGLSDTTNILVIAGTILTVLGILGLALL